MTSHVLDNPAWNAMISGNSHLALGNDRVKFFQDEVAPFAGLKNYDEIYLRELYDLIPLNRRVVIPTIRRLEIGAYWKLIDTVTALQMVFDKSRLPEVNNPGIVPLKAEHVAEMITLTQLTKPGPFLKRTIEFGNYKGIFDSGKLVAMAGQRMHPFEFVEISAVCTHPDYTGKGYGRALINDQILIINEDGNIPFFTCKSR